MRNDCAIIADLSQQSRLPNGNNVNDFKRFIIGLRLKKKLLQWKVPSLLDINSGE